MDIGTRVRLIKDVDNFPTIYAKAGETGVLAEIDSEGCYWVRLDRQFRELNEWQNRLAIWDWSTELGPDCHPSTFIAPYNEEPMFVLYTADNEGPARMQLDTLIANFDMSGGWQYRHNAEDMRHELASRGWYEGLHDNGRYLVLNIAKFFPEFTGHKVPEED